MPRPSSRQVGQTVWRYGSVRIAKIGDIAVDIHLSFALVIAWGAWQGWARYGSASGAAFGVLTVLLLFACILLHEFGHGLQARAFGLAVHRITLLPIGGLAELESSPSYYWHELLIALAGPMVNLGLAILLGSVAYLLQPFSLTSWPDYLLFLAPQSGMTLLRYAFWVNVLLFFSNMIPAFPMDGGRVMRAALAILTSYETGTRLTAWLGRLMAIGLAIWGGRGLLLGGARPNPILFVIALLVWVGAQHEEVYVRRRRALVQLEVESVCRAASDSVAPWDTLTPRLAARLERAGGTLPVVAGGRVVGMADLEDVRRALRSRQRRTVAHIMQTQFPTIQPQETLWVALQEMSTYQLAALPVMHGQVLYGIISLDDIRRSWS